MATNLIQAQTKNSIAMLYLADIVDGCTSCMLPLCQTYVTDCSAPTDRATNLGIFQGLSGTYELLVLSLQCCTSPHLFTTCTTTAGGAFVFAFPIGGILGAKYGPRVPLLAAAAIQLVNALVIIFVTPESNTNPSKGDLDLREANPIGALRKLFGRTHLLRIASTAYFLASLARCSLDAQFANYSNIKFGWTQAQSGPILVLVGLMLAIMPRIFVPLLGLKNAILVGLVTFAMGLTATGLSPTPLTFAASILLVSMGCICLPALQALLANLAADGERGALLGAVGSITELTGSIGSTLYGKYLCSIQTVGEVEHLTAVLLLSLSWTLSLVSLCVSISGRFGKVHIGESTHSRHSRYALFGRFGPPTARLERCFTRPLHPQGQPGAQHLVDDEAKR